MRYLLAIIAKILAVVIVFVAHICAVNILPYPFNHLNLVFFSSFYFLIFSSDKQIYWFVLPLSLLTEIFSSTPFGTGSIALIGSLFAVNWLLLNVFTTRSFITVILSFLIGYAFYRLIFITVLFLFNFIGVTVDISLSGIFLANLGAEISVNAILVLAAYPFSTLITTRPNPRYLSNRIS
jgi:hypothetical protein